MNAKPSSEPSPDKMINTLSHEQCRATGLRQRMQAGNTVRQLTNALLGDRELPVATVGSSRQPMRTVTYLNSPLSS